MAILTFSVFPLFLFSKILQQIEFFARLSSLGNKLQNDNILYDLLFATASWFGNSIYVPFLVLSVIFDCAVGTVTKKVNNEQAVIVFVYYIFY